MAPYISDFSEYEPQETPLQKLSRMASEEKEVLVSALINSGEQPSQVDRIKLLQEFFRARDSNANSPYYLFYEVKKRDPIKIKDWSLKVVVSFHLGRGSLDFDSLTEYLEEWPQGIKYTSNYGYKDVYEQHGEEILALILDKQRNAGSEIKEPDLLGVYYKGMHSDIVALVIGLDIFNFPNEHI